MLTGTARQLQEAQDRSEAQRLAYEIATKKLELKQLMLTREQVANGINRRASRRGEVDSSTRLTSAPGNSSGSGRTEKKMEG